MPNLKPTPMDGRGRRGTSWRHPAAGQLRHGRRDTPTDKPPRSLKELEVVVEQWRRDYNQIRPHSALGYRPPAPEAILANDLLPALAGLT